jgi:O-methyltransferase involved in polyketide biosynthesis
MRTYVHILRMARSDWKRRAKTVPWRSGRVIIRSEIYHSGMERIAVDLSGIPETLLWNLGRRAAAARTRRSLLKDPRAVEVVDRLDYDFADASRGAGWHAVRVATFDAAIRRFLARYPSGTVVALGEGLETQFWRVDNGRMWWVSVDLPETLELRHKLLPDGPRQRSHAGSALELEWLDHVDPANPTLTTAQGLFMYFQRKQVHELIAAMARRLPGASLIFDVVPAKMREMLQRLPDRESSAASRLWSWVFDCEERAAIGAIPGVTSVHDLTPPVALGLAPCVLGAVRRLPRQVRYAFPVLPILEVTFGSTD